MEGLSKQALMSRPTREQAKDFPRFHMALKLAAYVNLFCHIHRDGHFIRSLNSSAPYFTDKDKTPQI
jgi:hypothetical protein